MTAFVVGLTGPIGAGKSTVAGLLRDLGAKVLDADALARDEQLRGTVGYSAIVQQFGTGILDPDREIDRRKLADIVFADPRRLEQLERIVHPRVIARVLEARAMLPDDAVLVIEAIKLIETPLRSVCDRIWVVLADRPALIARLAGRGLSEEQVLARMAQQAPESELRAAAAVLLRNDGDRDALRAAVSAAWSGVRTPTA
ncbi:MAG TPA: dephospho-CoA kinase [Candidatus Saccharimonadales bacterium]|nr:dephospho-CoA kinase [Candidatus Saccharimonadales bacterium]